MPKVIDNKIIIDALKDKRAKLQDEINQLDAYIRTIRNAELKGDDAEPKEHIKEIHNKITVTTPTLFASPNSTKRTILQIMDTFKRPVKYNELQEEYEKLAGNNYVIRDIVRGMNKQRVMRLLKVNNSNKNAYWVKDEWINKETGLLLEEFDPSGLNIAYGADELVFK